MAFEIENPNRINTARALDRADVIHLAWQEFETAARTVPPHALPDFLANLEKVRLIAFARLFAPIPAPKSDELVDIDEAARRLGVSKHYLYRHARKLQFSRHVGRKLVFSTVGIDRFIAARR